MTDMEIAPALLRAGGDGAVLAGALLLYLASANRPRPAGPAGRRRLGRAGAAGLVAGQALLLAALGPAAAVFTAVTLAMLVWSVAPLLLAWWTRPRGEGAR